MPLHSPDANLKDEVGTLFDRLVSWVDDWTGPLEGAAIVTGVITAIAFALISARLFGGGD